MATHHQAPLSIAGQGCFWVNVERKPTPQGTLASGQMFVQYQIPAEQRHPYPVVMVHGGGGQGTDYLSTPDGRPGWATWFLRQGYAVYVVDRPGHGRAPFHPDALGPMSPPPPYEMISAMFCAPSPETAHWPQARLHNQWPGSGKPGDAALDQFMAALGPMIPDLAQTHERMKQCGIALLDRIGPAILITHSMGAPFGWIVADERPELVKGVVAVEPAGPTFDHIGPNMGKLDWGLTAVPLHFEPAATQASDIRIERRKAPAPGLLDCNVQVEPARKLPRLAGIPVAVLVGEASFMAPFEHGAVDFLTQAGVAAELLRLEDHGIHGNGHMVMSEKNSDDVAALIDQWLQHKVSK
jgi:pimeloyl-ACP methyl ester carboxylesterase